MPFIGKWSFATAAGHAVYADANSGRLMVGTPPAPERAHFNAYGTLAKCVLQASGGKYIAAEVGALWTEFVASLARDADPAHFVISPGSANSVAVSLWRLGGPIWVAKEDLTGYPLPAVDPDDTDAPMPASTLFARTIVTPGIDGLVAQPDMDLTWVCLAGADLGALGVTSLRGVDLTNADLSGATLHETDLTGATLHYTNFTNANLNALMGMVHGENVILNGAHAQGVKLLQASLRGAKLIGSDLSGPKTEVAAIDFTGADLTDAIFTGARVRSLTLIDADLTRVKLGNSPTNPSIDLSDATFSAKTNLTDANLQYVDLRNKDLSGGLRLARADLTGARLDGATLTNAEMAYATLTKATLTGIAMSGTNLSNADLTAANLAGAQLGAIGVLFRLVNDAAGKPAYSAFLTALNGGEITGVSNTFAANGITLTAPVSITASSSAAGRVWSVIAAERMYTIRLETIDATTSLSAYRPQTAAVLTNAFMKDAILTSANLYNVDASGVQLYGKAMLDGKVILEGADFADANLSGIDLKQAGAYGVNFSHATLTGAQLDGAQLTPNAEGAQVNFANANLQGASFLDAALGSAIFTDAAVAVAGDDGKVLGVWLFSALDATSLMTQLGVAANQLQLQAALAPHLTKGAVNADVVAAFNTVGITLSSSAVVLVQALGPLWTISDGATTYRVFEGCDPEIAVPALGVSVSGGLTPAFVIPLYLQGDLANGGTVSDAVVKAFAAAGRTLGQTATVTAGTMPTDWQIADPTAGSFDLWLGLNVDCTLAIALRPSMPAVRDLFGEHSLALTRRATVTNSATGWAVDNDSNNPFNAVTNYIKFNVVRGISGALDVYGSFLRVQQIGPEGAAIFRNVAVSLTALAQDQLQPTTVCPNSARTQTNIADQLPFREWMRATELPKPPFCVPSADGAFYCPPAEPRQRSSS